MIRQVPAAQAQPGGSESRETTPAALAERITAGIEHSSGRPLAVLVVHLMRPRRLESLTRVSKWELKLQEIALRITRILRPSDEYAWLSREKLCVVLSGLTDGGQAMLAAARLAAVLEDLRSAEAEDLAMRSSVGIALWPEHGGDADELVRAADLGANLAGKSGEDFHLIRSEDRSRIEVTDPKTERRWLQALRQNDFSVHYQPQIDIATGQCIGAEALLRWSASDGTTIPAATAVSIAEHAGLIAPLTFGVINSVLRDAVGFRRLGIDVNLSVNIATRMLMDMEMPDIVQQAIETWDMPASGLTFEITESVMIGDTERSLRVLERLRGTGIRLSIDDFGTGYSSLAYMKRFPVDELKIDKSFVGNMLTSKEDRQIVQTIIDLAHNFSLTVVAEGVENEETLAALRRMGCDVAQGYLFSRALPREDYGAWMKAWSGERRA